MQTALAYIGAAVAEIAGCFAFWSWLRLGASPWWLLPGLASLVLFAWLLTPSDAAPAGRACAAYGGVYICASLLCLWPVDVHRADPGSRRAAHHCSAGPASYHYLPRAT